MTRTEVPVVRKQVVVNAPAEQAFTAFTERFGDFKPPEHNLLTAAIAETAFDPYAGGHIYDRAVDGSECRPAAEVFAYATGPARFHEWQQGIIDGHLGQPGPAQVGTKCLTPRRIGGANRAVTSELTHIDAPRTWGVQGIDGSIRHRRRHRGTPDRNQFPADHRGQLRRARHRQTARPRSSSATKRTRKCQPTPKP